MHPPPAGQARRARKPAACGSGPGGAGGARPTAEPAAGLGNGTGVGVGAPAAAVGPRHGGSGGSSGQLRVVVRSRCR